MAFLSLAMAMLLVCYLFDQGCLWLERKGWLYYRHKKCQTSGLGSALQELQAQLLPSSRYVIEVKQNEAQFKQSHSDASSEPVD